MSENEPTTDRRASEQRRAAGERRRQADGKRVVIEICRSQLHMAIVAPEGRGDGEILLCRSHQWRVKSTSLLGPGGPEELRIAFKQLAVEERLAGAATTVLLTGDLCVSRVAIGSSNEVDTEINELTERSQLYLALGAGEKAAATDRFQLDARHEHAVMSVANQATVNSVVEAAESAGLELRAVEASTVALCRSHHELHAEDNPVVLVQLDENGVEIALSHRGRLLLEHRPGGKVKPEKVADLLKQHHSRLVRYCHRQGIAGEQGLSKVYLTGSAELIADAEKNIPSDSSVNFERLNLDSASDRWKIREAPPTGEHAAVLGGAFANEDSQQRSGPNLLERWIAESRKHIRPMLIRSAVPIAATLLVAAGLWFLNGELNEENNVLQAELDRVSAAELQSKQVRFRLLSIKAKITQLKKLEEVTPHAPLAQFVEYVSGCLPNDVWLEQLQLTDGKTVRINGSSYTDPGPSEFLRHLNQAPGLQQANLEEASNTIGSRGRVTKFRASASFRADKMNEPNDASIAGTLAGKPR